MAYFFVVVVVGAHGEAVAEALAGLPVRTVDNPEWQEGMGRSLRVGVRALPEVEAVLVLLCDQLRVDSAHLRALVDTFARTRRWRTSARSPIPRRITPLI